MKQKKKKTLTTDEQKVVKLILWHMGCLDWKLKPVQRDMLQSYNACVDDLKFVINCSRRLGKSFLLCCIAIGFALSTANAQIRYAAPTQKALKKIVHPLFKKIIDDCPCSCRPEWKSQDGMYQFPNGSQIHLAGANNGHDEDLRGTEAHLALIDEAGFIDDLTYLVDDILMPQLLTTGGRLIMASTPARSPAHAFNEYAIEAKHHGNYAHYTIFDAGYDDELIQKFCKEAGGVKSSTWKREYMADLYVTDESSAIIPEAANFKPGIVRDLENYKHYHKYVAMDLGVKHLTVVVFAYYDFLRAKICVEREFVINGPQMTTIKLKNGIETIEHKLWQGAEPYKRIADNNNPLLLLDLGSIHGMFFSSTSKDTLNAMVNEMRIWFANDRVEIDESCKVTIDSVRYGIWNDQRTDFAVSKTLGHFDAVAAIMYLIRNIDQATNPIPVKRSFDMIIDEEVTQYSELRQIFGRG